MSEDRRQAARIDWFDFSAPAMRAFHMAWLAFFLCFFAWFGIAPLMPVIREQMHFSKQQVGWCMIGSVSITIFARLLIGWACDRFGPRLTFTWLLLVGSLPVMAIGLAHDFQTFLLFRVLIGAIGGSFVVTQCHMSLMFAPNCVGQANATTAGWGNLGGGVAQFAMPWLFALAVGALGFTPEAGWRVAMVFAGLLCAAAGVAYYFLTQDAPAGNFRRLRVAGKLAPAAASWAGFLEACRDVRVWVLFALYGACFGIELTINNVAALYFVDYFAEFQRMDAARALQIAGLIAGSFGLMNLFARSLGGALGDKCGGRWGLPGRVRWLFAVVFCEGLALLLFSQTSTLRVAIPSLIVFSLFVQMAEGATFAVAPLVNPRAVGSVAGIVGAGGNVAAVLAGFLFKSESLDWPTALLLLGVAVTACSFLSFAVTFNPAPQTSERPVLRPAAAPAAELATARV